MSAQLISPIIGVVLLLSSWSILGWIAAGHFHPFFSPNINNIHSFCTLSAPMKVYGLLELQTDRQKLTN